MKFREMTESDIEFMAVHSASKGIFDKMPSQIAYAYAVEQDGVVLGVGGIQLINSVTAWVWVDISEYGRTMMKSGYRIIKEWLDELIKIHKLKRLQAYVRLDFPEAIRMIEHLGFKIECVMKKFTDDGKDAFLYVKFME